MGAIHGGAVESIVNQLVIQKMRYSLLMTKSSQRLTDTAVLEADLQRQGLKDGVFQRITDLIP